MKLEKHEMDKLFPADPCVITTVRMKKEEVMNKNFYLGSVAVAGILGVLLSAVGQLWFGALLSVYAGVVALVMWYKAWKAIQDGHARTTPGKAVGFLFIPFFNIYWIFQAFWGFAKDHNAYLGRHGGSASKLPEGLFLAYCILLLLAGFMGRIPVVGPVLGIANWVVLVLIVNNVCDRVNNLPQISEQSVEPDPQT